MLALSFALLVLILNPYTIFGPLAYYLGLPLAAVAFFFGKKYLQKQILFCLLALMAISLVGVFSSVLHGITQFEHFKVAVSISIYYLIGVGIYICTKKNIYDILVAALYAAILNCIVILTQVQFPEFRSIIESIFVESGNIDWTQGFRYRGLASGGGASLSVLSGCMVWICLYLYSVKKIGELLTIVSLAILIASVLFIGRTGILLILIALVFYVLLQGWRNISNIVLTIGLFGFVIFFGFEYLKGFLIQEYGEGFYWYSLGFLLEGGRGIEDEGTAGQIAEFLTVVPKELPQTLIGYGFYGGSDFYPWTDSGYARMFTSVGFVFGFLFYGCAFYIFTNAARKKQKLFWPLIALLAVAEAKEGILFAGYSSRLIFILMGFWTAQKLQTYRLSSSKIAAQPVLQ